MKSYVSVAIVCVLLTSLSLAFVSPASKRLSSFDPQVTELLSRMTVDEKIGQMIQPELTPILNEPGDMQKYFIGSVLSGGDSDPKEGNSLQAWTDVYDKVQSEALKTRLAIPILYGIDAVHGHSNVLGAVMFPHNIALGCTRDAKLVEKIGRITAEEVRATGIQWTFGPCVAVPQDIRWGRTYEGFSEDPRIVKSLGEATVRGMQGLDLSRPLSILACAEGRCGIRTMMVVPTPGEDSSVKVPPTSLTRSCMPSSPKRACPPSGRRAAPASQPRPSSSTMSDTWPSLRSRRTLTRFACAWRLTFVRASWATR